jgi:hypothetical protein
MKDTLAVIIVVILCVTCWVAGARAGYDNGFNHGAAAVLQKDTEILRRCLSQERP